MERALERRGRDRGVRRPRHPGRRRAVSRRVPAPGRDLPLGGGEERQLRLLRRRALAVRRVGRRSPLLPGRRVCRLAGDLRLRLARPGRRGRPVRAQAHRLARLRDPDTVERRPIAVVAGTVDDAARQGRLDPRRVPRPAVGSVRARESGGLVSRRGRDPGRCARGCASRPSGRAWPVPGSPAGPVRGRLSAARLPGSSRRRCGSA